MGPAAEGFPCLGCRALSQWCKLRHEAWSQVRDSKDPNALPKDPDLLPGVNHALHVSSASSIHSDLNHGFVSPGIGVIGLHGFGHVNRSADIVLQRHRRACSFDEPRSS